jgi:ABC-2 type transport system ATP-binding protein
MTPALDIARVDHRIGSKPVLKQVSFSVAPGDFTVLLGLNGAGKSTLFSLITRLFNTQAGSISIFGHDIGREPRAGLGRMGVVFQQPTLDLDLSLDQNLHYHCALHGMARDLADTRITRELGRVGLMERRGDKARSLSGGQRRRVELARALLHDPALLLLDEPTVGLDMASRKFLLAHVRELCAEQKLAVLWATHLLDEAGADARIIVLDKGEVKGNGSVAEILAQADRPDLASAFQTIVGLDKREDAA